MKMMDEVVSTFKNSRNSFENNINDEFSRAIVCDYFEPCSHELERLRAAIEEARREEQGIQDMLRQVRSMV